MLQEEVVALELIVIYLSQLPLKYLLTCLCTCLQANAIVSKFRCRVSV